MCSKPQYIPANWPTDSDRLINQNLKLVPFVVYRYCKKYFDYCDADDLIGVGNIGLVKAARNYKPEESKFSTYAIKMIYGEIRHYIRDKCSTLYCDRPIKDLHTKIAKANLFEAPVEMISKKLGADEISVKRALDYEAGRVIRSLYEPYRTTTKPDPQILADTLSFQEDFEFSIMLEEITDSLNPFERQVFQLKYILDLKQGDVGQKLGCGQPLISKTLKRIRLKVKAFLSESQFQVAQ